MKKTAANLLETAEFMQTLGADGMDGISAMNLALDVYEVVPALKAVSDAAAAFYAALVDGGGEWDVSPATTEWLALQEALREVGGFEESVV